MEYLIGGFISLFIAGIILVYKKDIADILRKIPFIKKFPKKKTVDYNIAEHDKLHDMDLLARKIARAWWKEYDKRLLIKIILVILLLIIGVNAVGIYMDSVVSQLKGLLSSLSQS